MGLYRSEQIKINIYILAVKQKINSWYCQIKDAWIYLCNYLLMFLMTNNSFTLFDTSHLI